MNNSASRLCAMGFPALFASKTLDTFEPATPELREHLAWARAYAASVPTSPAGGLLLGAPGTGKTHLAAGIAAAAGELLPPLFREVTSQPVERVHYATLSDAAAAVRRSFGAAPTFGAKIDPRARLLDVRLLILDEVGATRSSQWETDLLWEVLDHRYGALYPTLLVSNLSAKGMEDYLTFRGIDRLREHGAEVRVFTGESWRGR